MAAPTWQSANNASESDGTVLVTAPASIADDDFLLQTGSTDFSGAGDTTYTQASGFTDCGSGYINADNTGASVSGQIFYKIASSESGNYTMTESAANLSGSVVARITGVNTTSTIHKFASNSGTASEPVIPSVTTTIADCLIVSMVTWDQSKTYVDGIAEAGWTIGSTIDVSGHDQIVSYKALASAGASGAVNVNISSATRWVAFTIAIAPESTTTPIPVFQAAYRMMRGC